MRYFVFPFLCSSITITLLQSSGYYRFEADYEQIRSFLVDDSSSIYGDRLWRYYDQALYPSA